MGLKCKYTCKCGTFILRRQGHFGTAQCTCFKIGGGSKAVDHGAKPTQSLDSGILVNIYNYILDTFDLVAVTSFLVPLVQKKGWATQMFIDDIGVL